jgi:glutamate N-acetyltransferase/amino-acid N-acetyltransferase
VNASSTTISNAEIDNAESTDISNEITVIAGGITSPKGFKAAGAIAGIKKNGKPDMAIIFSDVPAACAAVFTTNVMKAAPIVWNQTVLAESESGKAQAIVINSGNANACTGTQGMVNTEAMAVSCAAATGIAANMVLVASTGVIGVQLPMDKVISGILATSKLLSSTADAGHEAAVAITTTDTYEKQVCVQFSLSGKLVTIGAMAKGSGMIHPNMATMLGFVTTDANITAELLHKSLKESVASSYNMISVDGDTSTNDMVTVMANGQADNVLIENEGQDFQLFSKALNFLNIEVAKSIAKDGEGATKFLEVVVTKAPTLQDARVIARSVVSSSLVKAAFFGEDANWGRVICAMGYSGSQFDPAKVSISMKSSGGHLPLMADGEPLPLDEEIAKKVLAEKQILVNISLESGECHATAWGCDLSYDYVKINGAYRT